MMLDRGKTALLVIDVQRAFDFIEAAGNRRNNPDALTKIAALIGAFRRANAPIIHIRHASTETGSMFRPEAPGYAVKDEAREEPGEAVIVKSINSAFIGTDLERRLRDGGIDTLIIAGATTNHCVETTTRMAGNLGFATFLVEDAAWTFDRTGPDGRVFDAETLHAITLANLHGEFCTVIKAAEVVEEMSAKSMG